MSIYEKNESHLPNNACPRINDANKPILKADAIYYVPRRFWWQLLRTTAWFD
jgi:hypothetical protein